MIGNWKVFGDVGNFGVLDGFLRGGRGLGFGLAGIWEFFSLN
jgi:hypothetical protein